MKFIYVIFFVIACGVMYIQHKEIRSLKKANDELVVSYNLAISDLYNCGEYLQLYEQAFSTLERQDPSMSYKFDLLINNIQTQ